MVKKHLKRINAPKSWKIKRKGITFVTKPNSGMHGKRNSASINMVLRDMLKYAKTTRDIKMIINEGGVLVDKKQVKDHHFQVGVMDLIEMPKINKCFRVMLDKKGNLDLVEIKGSEMMIKPCKIVNKKPVKKGKMQLNLNDGRNILVDKNDFKTGDTLLIEFPKQKIKEHLKFEKNACVYLAGGKHKGESGTLEEIKDGFVKVKPKSGNSFETLKKFAFVIGKEEPRITLAQ